MKLGIIGCGAIGSVLCRFIDNELEGSELVAICDIDEAKVEKLAESLKSKPSVLDIDELVEKKRWIGDTYNQKLQDLPGIILPQEKSWAKNNYWMYVIIRI